MLELAADLITLRPGLLGAALVVAATVLVAALVGGKAGGAATRSLLFAACVGAAALVFATTWTLDDVGDARDAAEQVRSEVVEEVAVVRAGSVEVTCRASLVHGTARLDCGWPPRHAHPTEPAPRQVDTDAGRLTGTETEASWCVDLHAEMPPLIDDAHAEDCVTVDPDRVEER